MTRDEVMAMTDEELWFEALMLARPELGIWRSLGIGHSEDGRAYIGPVGKPVEWQEDCDYPNDIVSAWELVEKMRGDDKSVWVDVFANANGWEVEIDDDCTSSIEGDTAARAITRAFILEMADKEATD